MKNKSLEKKNVLNRGEKIFIDLKGIQVDDILYTLKDSENEFIEFLKHLNYSKRVIKDMVFLRNLQLKYNVIN